MHGIVFRGNVIKKSVYDDVTCTSLLLIFFAAT